MSIELCLWVLEDLRNKLIADKIRTTLAEGKKLLAIAGKYHTQVLEKKFPDQTCARKSMMVP